MPVRPLSTRERLARLLIPERHGEIGNFVTELYTFSRRRWRKLFIEMGWQVETVFAGGLFYTGYSVLGDHLSLSAREKLSARTGVCLFGLHRQIASLTPLKLICVLKRHPTKCSSTIFCQLSLCVFAPSRLCVMFLALTECLLPLTDFDAMTLR